MIAENEPWKILYVEDDQVLGRQIKEAQELGAFGPVVVEVIPGFAGAKEEIEGRRYDLLILDIFEGRPSLEKERAGVDILQHLKQVRFTPTIFYTALPAAIGDPISPFIRVVGKEGGGLDRLIDAVQEFIDSGLLNLNRGLLRHVEKVQLDYMEGFVTARWSEFSTMVDKRSLAYLMARRLAMSLSSTYISELAKALGETAIDDEATTSANELVHRMQFYIMPPVSGDFLTGDIFEGEVKGRTGYWVLLTPSCDMVTGRVKADFVHLAYCQPLTEFREYQDWTAQSSNTKKKALVELLKNNRASGQAERYHYLPGVAQIPHLIVDFKQVEYLPFAELKAMSPGRYTSLDSPYAEVLLARYNRFSARFGAPDLDTDEVLRSLRPTQDKSGS